MRKVFGSLLVLGLVASAAMAQDESYRLFLSQSNRAGYTYAAVNPVVSDTFSDSIGQRLYLYVEYGTNNQEFNGFNLRFDLTGGALFTGGAFYNPTITGIPRWQTITTGSPTVGSAVWTTGNISKVGGAGFGAKNVPLGTVVANDGDFSNTDGSAFGTTLLAYMDVDAAAIGNALFIQNGTSGGAGVTIVANDFVYFGFLDAAVVNKKGGAVGGAGGPTPIAEATFIPEPVSLALLGLGALVLRRRR